MKPSEIAEIWNVSTSIVRRYCLEGRIEGAVFEDEKWLIPEYAKHPERKIIENRYLFSLPAKVGAKVCIRQNAMLKTRNHRWKVAKGMKRLYT